MLRDGVGEVACYRCRKTVMVLRFTPVVASAAVSPGTGRCAHHPNKDAAFGCERCGSFVCDVCVTRTGDRVLCPACFEILHTRGDLATTRARRTRWDYLTLNAGFATVVCGFLAPLAFVLGVVTLVKRRREPWLSLGPTFGGMAVATLWIGFWFLVGFLGRSGR